MKRRVSYGCHNSAAGVYYPSTALLFHCRTCPCVWVLHKDTDDSNLLYAWSSNIKFAVSSCPAVTFHFLISRQQSLLRCSPLDHFLFDTICTYLISKPRWSIHTGHTSHRVVLVGTYPHSSIAVGCCSVLWTSTNPPYKGGRGAVLPDPDFPAARPTAVQAARDKVALLFTVLYYTPYTLHMILSL